MNKLCDYCRGPIAGTSFDGRPRPDCDRGADRNDCPTYCCYGCLSLGEAKRHAAGPGQQQRFRLDGFTIRLGIGLLVAGQSMVFGLAINLEDQTPGLVKTGVQGIILGGTLLVLALLGPPLFRNAFREASRGRVTIEALFLLTMAGALAASLQSFLTGQGPVYFEVVSVLLVVYALGKAIGASSRSTALAYAKQWSESLSVCRFVDSAGRVRTMEVGMVLPGDVVEVRPGETVAIDGVIRSGAGFVCEAPVSGEPFAAVRRPGDRVLAGMAVRDATFRIEATAGGDSRQVDRLLQAVEQAQTQPAGLQAQADRLSSLFVPLIVGVAALTFTAWSLREDWQAGLFNAMSVLLVACPCALGLATPIVIWSALGRLAERGLVVHSGDAVERLAGVDQVVFDKTGTLTEERFGLVDIATWAEGDERARLLGWLALVEEQSRHPIAQPFAQLPKPFATHEMPRVISFTVIPGCGVEAQIADPRDGERCVRIGTQQWLEATSATAPELLARLRAKAGHRIDCAVDGRLAAIALVAERLRDSVPETLAQLHALALPVQVLTGDARPTPLFSLPFEGRAGGAFALPRVSSAMLPDDKRQRLIEVQKAGGKPLMVGDGINDAAALAVAHVGVALSSGTELANSAAAATLYHGDLRVLPWAIAVSREAVRAVRRNLLRAIGYNVIGIALAAFGLLHPVAAALLMMASSALVAWSSVRISMAMPVLCGNSGCEPAPLVRRERGLRWSAWVHAAAFALQAVVIMLLLSLAPSAAALVFATFALIGATSSCAWSRATSPPHWLDMSFGMLTLGNLGMLLGWWADNGFAPLHDAGCCECVEAMREGLARPWMWVGMLLFANLAMLFAMRRPHADVPWCKTAMFSGGNLGMAAGMLLGGWLAGRFETDSVTRGAIASFAGMTVGMVGGMLIGSTLALRGLDALASIAGFQAKGLEETSPETSAARP
jgi:P-type Cu+ transporter